MRGARPYGACSHSSAPRLADPRPIRTRPHPCPRRTSKNLSTFVNTWCEPELEALMHKVGGWVRRAGAHPPAYVAGASAPAVVRHRAGYRPACWPHPSPPLSSAPLPPDPGLYNLADAVQYPSAAEMEKRWAATPGAMHACNHTAARGACPPAALCAARCRPLCCCCCPSCAACLPACRCVSFLAHLWHCQDDFVGTGGRHWQGAVGGGGPHARRQGRAPTQLPPRLAAGAGAHPHAAHPPLRPPAGCVGSTEACYLGGLAMKKQWQQRRRAAGLPADRPNIVVSHVAQVCWQKVRRAGGVGRGKARPHRAAAQAPRPGGLRICDPLPLPLPPAPCTVLLLFWWVACNGGPGWGVVSQAAACLQTCSPAAQPIATLARTPPQTWSLDTLTSPPAAWVRGRACALAALAASPAPRCTRPAWASSVLPPQLLPPQSLRSHGPRENARAD